MSSDGSEVTNEDIESTGSQDDESTGGSTSSDNRGQNPPTEFYKRLHAWMVLYDRDNHLQGEIAQQDAEATQGSRPERDAALVAKRTAEINLERARVSLRDWLRANDRNGELQTHFEKARDELSPRFQERHQRMRKVAVAYGALKDCQTSSSGTDQRYENAQREYNDAIDDHAANEQVIAAIIDSAKAAMEHVPGQANGGHRDNAQDARAQPGSPMTPAEVFARALTQPRAEGGGPLQDNIFKGTKIASAYPVIPEYQGLKWPDNHERASLLERTQVNSLRVGFVLPILHFTGVESFANLTAPDAYYVVTAEFQDNSTRLALAYKNPACNRTLPPGLTFGARAEAYSVIAMADAAIRGNILDAHVLAALRAPGVPLTAPDTPFAHRLSGAYGQGHYGSRDAQAKADKTMLPLRRALHNDKGKLLKITQYATEQKLTDPAIATAIRNMQTSTRLHGIPALAPDNIPHLLGFNWCVDPEFTGTSKKADALSIAMFLKNRPGEVRTLQDIDDVLQAVDNMKGVYTTLAMEDRTTDFQFYGRLFNQLRDQLLENAEGHSVEHLHIDFLVRQLNKMFTEWSKLFKVDKYVNTAIDEFFRVNEAILRFNPVEWLDTYSRVDIKQIPPQKGTRPPGRDDDRKQRRDNKRQAAGRPDRGRKDKKRQRREESPPKQRDKPDKRQPQAAVPPKPAPKAGHQASEDICIRHLFHHANPAVFKAPCTRKPCPRSHNPTLHNGKLTEGEKAAVRGGLQAMEGKFADLALQHLDTMF